jgi:transposase
VARARALWRRRQGALEPRRLVFNDETWAKTNMARTRGRCRRGARLICRVPHGHWKTTTFVAALRLERITAPVVVEGPINGLIFRIYVERPLAPTLSPGDIVILDNLSSHKSAEVRRLVEQQGASLVLLPPYSPDLTPIELAFAKLKAGLRKAAERSIDNLCERIGQLLDEFDTDQCNVFLRQAGYALN